jgi:hypothetical protein
MVMPVITSMYGLIRFRAGSGQADVTRCPVRRDQMPRSEMTDRMLGQSPAADRRFSARSVRSQEKSGSSRPKWP